MTPCTCGEPHPHTIATRRTFDGALVELTSDGALWVNGQRSPESGAAPVRTDDAANRARRVGWLVLADACILDATEVTELYRRGRALPTAPATMRELRAALDKPTRPSLVWTVVSADRDGTPTERVCVLPRLRWPGMAVFDYCGGPGSAGGRYVLCYRLSGTRDTYSEAFRFARLADLWKHLESL